jgi:predicted DCC family thiol-disulfide oxidoreductase YuxK
MQKRSALIYDNSCKLCNRAIRFLEPEKGSADMLFIPAGEPESKQIMRQYKIPGELTSKTVIFIDKERVYFKSDALIKALQKKGGLWKIFSVFGIIPGFIRNAVYDWIASKRRKWMIP